MATVPHGHRSRDDHLPPWEYRSLRGNTTTRSGIGVTLTDGRVSVTVDADELAVVRSALDGVRARRPERVDELLRTLHAAEQGATIALTPDDSATLRAALHDEQQRTPRLGRLRLLLL